LAILDEEVILIDTPADMVRKLSRESISDIGCIFLNHSHYDHVGGMGDLEFYVHLKRKRALPVYMTEETWQQIQKRYDFMIDCLGVNIIEPGKVCNVGKVTLTALQASHAPGTLGYIIEHNGRSIAYMPDTGPLCEEAKNACGASNVWYWIRPSGGITGFLTITFLLMKQSLSVRSLVYNSFI
jgi:phosphoribosyl 1,2-cyclic phosphate phosphodiesterase